MAIETFGFIDDLNAANPTATDNVSEGDDHLRGLKTTLKNTFPNVTGAITATETELNILDGVTATTTELNILDGVTSTAAELNILDGVTATTAELNYVDGVTSNIQTQLGTKLESETSHADVLVDADVGTTANKIVQLNASAELPAVSGANLTNLPAAGETAAMWVSLKGTGTISIDSSYYVSSVIDKGTGEYEFYFTTSFTSVNSYTAVATGSAGTGPNSMGIEAKDSTYIAVQNRNSTVAIDSYRVAVIAFGG